MSDSPLDTDSPRIQRSAINRLLVHLRENVSPHKITWPLAGFCFMTGFVRQRLLCLDDASHCVQVDAVTFTTCFVWYAFPRTQRSATKLLLMQLTRVAFQTGSSIQLSLALARVASPGPGITNRSLQVSCTYRSFWSRLYNTFIPPFRPRIDRYYARCSRFSSELCLVKSRT